MAKQESRSPTSSPNADSIKKRGSSGSQAQKGGDVPRGYNVATRRFLSLCMEDIEPVMEMRGKDTMYQCCYCGKWCSMSGTRALSKHIENEHRPQVIVQIQSFLQSLDIKLQPSESKIVYIGFLPLAHWNVHLEATIHCSQGSQTWASLLPIHEVKDSADSAQGRQFLHLKMTSAKPYLPRPTWSDAEHARQRVGVKISESLEELSRSAGGPDRAPSGFAIKVEAPATPLKESLEAEISLSLKVHGKEAAIVLPLTIANDVQAPKDAPSPAASNVADVAQWANLAVKRERSQDEDAGSPSKRASSAAHKAQPAADASGMAQLTLVAAQQQAMAQHLAASHFAQQQAMAMRAIQGGQVHPFMYVGAGRQVPNPMQGLSLGDLAMDAQGNILRQPQPQPQPHMYGIGGAVGNVSVSEARLHDSSPGHPGHGFMPVGSGLDASGMS